MSIDEKLLSLVYSNDVSSLRCALSSGADVAATDRDGRNPLMHAILYDSCNSGVVSLLIEHGADVNHKDKGQRWSALAFAARDKSPEICNLLIDAGAVIDSVDSFGNTPLWRAVMARQERNISLLVTRGANQDFKNNFGVSPRLLAKQIGVEYFV